ncbi:MAG TPA: hypothetical protein VKW06_15955 [Candidatus Angelobacter sp.]|nr:hypothetical protein [Candidatus Angelobacter sp.]
MALVLYAGISPTLAYTRRLLLEDGGHTVITVLSDLQLAETCRQQKFDVAIITHTATPRLKQEWLSTIRELCPSARILELHRQNADPTLPGADASLEIGHPEKLVASVTVLAKR